MRSSRSSGRSATTAVASVNTFRRAHNPVPNIIIPSPPRVPAHDQLPRDPRPARFSYRWSLLLARSSRCFGCANRADAPSWLSADSDARRVATPVNVAGRRRCSPSRVPSNRINKWRVESRSNWPLPFKSVRKRIAGGSREIPEKLQCVITAKKKSMLSLGCLSDNGFQREIIRSTHTREYPYQRFPSSRIQKERKRDRKMGKEREEGKRERESHSPRAQFMNRQFFSFSVAICRDFPRDRSRRFSRSNYRDADKSIITVFFSGEPWASVTLRSDAHTHPVATKTAIHT